MGFAIPSNQVKRVAEEIIATGRVRRAKIGASLADKEAVRRINPSVIIERGVYVYRVENGGPAQEAGIRAGDIILEIGGLQVSKVAAVQAFLSEKSPGEVVKVKVLRGNQEIVLEVTLGEASS